MKKMTCEIETYRYWPAAVFEIALERHLGQSVAVKEVLDQTKRFEEIVESEPECPGEMPDEMWEAIKGDSKAVEKAIQLGVKQTKENILMRLKLGDKS